MLGGVYDFVSKQYRDHEDYEATMIQCAWRLFAAQRLRVQMEEEKQAELKELFAKARADKRKKAEKNRPRQF